MWVLSHCGRRLRYKIHPNDVRKAFQGSRSELLHQVFHLRIQHHILGKSPVCCVRTSGLVDPRLKTHRRYMFVSATNSSCGRSRFPSPGDMAHCIISQPLLFCADRIRERAFLTLSLASSDDIVYYDCGVSDVCVERTISSAPIWVKSSVNQTHDLVFKERMHLYFVEIVRPWN